MSDRWTLFEHEKFEELTALAHSGILTASEWSELRSHLEVCADCQEAYSQYESLSREGMPLLAARFSNVDEKEFPQNVPGPTKLLAQIREARAKSFGNLSPRMSQRIFAYPLVRVGVAAIILFAVGIVSYRLGGRTQSQGRESKSLAAENISQDRAADKKEGVVEIVDGNSEKLIQLKRELERRDQSLAALQTTVRELTEHANELAVAKSSTADQLQSIFAQRDALITQLHDAEQQYQNSQAELANLHTEHNKTVSRIASDQTRIDDLTAVNLDYERRLRGDEQYLASDRDIRELMGARKLYIADVFDVDSRGRTQKRFGRVFYTQGKSLVFYAFDLDSQPDLKNGSTFQAWGRRDLDSKEPLNLGIFYVDSESNRRWALRFDDPKELAEIDSVFVTAEPRGGSQKPTGKPFLYALLHGEANHP